MKFKIIYTAFFLLMIVFFSCENTIAKKELTETERAVYLEKGKEITSQAFAALGGKLQWAMKEGGVPNAINYCRLNAMPIIDSLSHAYHCEIRRTSAKARNPLNKATRTEDVILKTFEKNLREQNSAAPVVEYNQTKSISYYAPIQVNAFCLQCHGKVGETLQENDYALIKEQYPNDKATGYVAGELRGMWRVTFQN